MHKTKSLPVTDAIGEQGGKLSPCQSREVSDGGRVRTSDKPVSAALQPNEHSLHLGQTSVGQLPSAFTKHWKSDADVLHSCLENKEICMEAACALYRQRKLTFQPTKRDRATELAEFLLDGNLQGPLKRTTEELMKHDPQAHNFLEKMVLRYSEQLFDIYMNKRDPFFR
uniref:Uncharacterized protein n=1 Tax=Arundo donax TaxID=35708 RepID=A0A0A8Z7R3_ARUDO